MNYATPQINKGLIGTLLLVAAAFVFFFHTLPTNKQTDALKNILIELKNDVSKMENEIAGVPAADSEVSEVERKELFRAIPEKLEQDIIISDLDLLIKTADVSFNALTFNLQKSENLPAVTINGGFQGTSANSIRFLKMLEVNPRKFIIKNVNVSRAETDDGLDIVNLTVTLQAFYRNNE